MHALVIAHKTSSRNSHHTHTKKNTSSVIKNNLFAVLFDHCDEHIPDAERECGCEMRGIKVFRVMTTGTPFRIVSLTDFRTKMYKLV